jgi:hypothetical protein
MLSQHTRENERDETVETTMNASLRAAAVSALPAFLGCFTAVSLTYGFLFTPYTPWQSYFIANKRRLLSRHFIGLHGTAKSM